MSQAEQEEWQEWAESWRDEETSAVPAPSGLQRKVKRHARGLWLLTIGEGALTAVLLGLTGVVVLQDSHPISVLGMAGASLICVAAMGFALWNRHGTWAPAANTTRAFIEISLLRNARKRRTEVAVVVLLLVEWCFLIALGVWSAVARLAHFSYHSTRFVLAYGGAFVFTALVAVWWVRFRRQNRQERRELESLAEELFGSSDNQALPGETRAR